MLWTSFSAREAGAIALAHGAGGAGEGDDEAFVAGQFGELAGLAFKVGKGRVRHLPADTDIAALEQLGTDRHGFDRFGKGGGRNEIGVFANGLLDLGGHGEHFVAGDHAVFVAVDAVEPGGVVSFFACDFAITILVQAVKHAVGEGRGIFFYSTGLQGLAGFIERDHAVLVQVEPGHQLRRQFIGGELAVAVLVELLELGFQAQFADLLGNGHDSDCGEDEADKEGRAAEETDHDRRGEGRETAEAWNSCVSCRGSLLWP